MKFSEESIEEFVLRMSNWLKHGDFSGVFGGTTRLNLSQAVEIIEVLRMELEYFRKGYQRNLDNDVEGSKKELRELQERFNLLKDDSNYYRGVFNQLMNLRGERRRLEELLDVRVGMEGDEFNY